MVDIYNIKDFTPKVIIRPSKKRYGLAQLELLSAVIISTEENGKFTFGKGFTSDAASIPFGFRNIFPSISKYLGAAFIHDQYCALSRSTGEYYHRKTGDNMFYSLLRECGVAKWRAMSMSSAVKAQGKYFKMSGKLK